MYNLVTSSLQAFQVLTIAMLEAMVSTLQAAWSYMAGVPKDIYTFTVDGAVIGVKLPRDYYNAIDTICGLTKATDANKPRIVLGVTAAIKSGAVAPLGILYLKDGKLRRARIVCAVTALQGAMAGLIGKNYRTTNPIRGAYFTTQRTLG